MKDKNIQIIAHNLQKAIEEIDNIKQYIEEEATNVPFSIDIGAARDKSQSQGRIEYLLSHLYLQIDKKASKGLYEHKEVFKPLEEPSITQADLIAGEIESKGFKVTLDSIENNKVKEIHIEWS